MTISFDIKKIWEHNRYEFFVTVCVILLLIMSFANKVSGRNGTWSIDYKEELDFLNSKYGKKPRNINKFISNSRHLYGKMSKGEARCKFLLEKVFGKPFNKARPNFLRNNITEGENNLELDCYNEDLNLAVEYNGAQHYKYIPFFHKSKEVFYNQKYRDDMKVRLCREKGVNLISVPYDVPDIEKFLIGELYKLGYINKRQ